MTFFDEIGLIFTNSLLGVWFGTVNFVPKLIIAIIIYAFGWILATLIQRVIEGIFKSFKVDNLIKATGVEDVIERSGYKLNSGSFVGVLVKWFVIVVFLVAALDMIGLTQVTDFLKNVVLGYLPLVIIAVLILMVSVVIADALQKVVVASAKATHIKSAVLLGTLTKWAIWIFAILAALIQLRIAEGIVQPLILGVTFALSLAIGLAFGLGGKEVAGRMLEKTIRTVSDKE